MTPMRVQLTGNADDALIVRPRQSCDAITPGTLDSYEGFQIEYRCVFPGLEMTALKDTDTSEALAKRESISSATTRM